MIAYEDRDEESQATMLAYLERRPTPPRLFSLGNIVLLGLAAAQAAYMILPYVRF